MLIAFNNDVQYGPQMYHIQTEDTGPRDQHITTTVFLGGRTLESVRTPYAGAVAGIQSEAERDAIVRKMMVNQHRYCYTKLYTGAYDDKIASMS